MINLTNLIYAVLAWAIVWAIVEFLGWGMLAIICGAAIIVIVIREIGSALKTWEDQ